MHDRFFHHSFLLFFSIFCSFIKWSVGAKYECHATRGHRASGVSEKVIKLQHKHSYTRISIPISWKLLCTTYKYYVRELTKSHWNQCWHIACVRACLRVSAERRLALSWTLIRFSTAFCSAHAVVRVIRLNTTWNKTAAADEPKGSISHWVVCVFVQSMRFNVDTGFQR